MSDWLKRTVHVGGRQPLPDLPAPLHRNFSRALVTASGSPKLVALLPELPTTVFEVVGRLRRQSRVELEAGPRGVGEDLPRDPKVPVVVHQRPDVPTAPGRALEGGKGERSKPRFLRRGRVVDVGDARQQKPTAPRRVLHGRRLLSSTVVGSDALSSVVARCDALDDRDVGPVGLWMHRGL